jgi:ubiquinone/menaquinone biosynthesis C-methylase UbiE
VNFDPDAIRAFEQAGWQRAAGDYDATFARASGEFVVALLDASGVTAGERLLDLCCGTGLVTEAAARRGARASGLDFSPAMLTAARAAHPALAFEEGDAEALPAAAASIDVVVANFGIHHLPRPERALAEMLRVLRPGGRLAVTSWAVPAQNIAWKLLFDAVRLHGDLDAANAPPSGGNLGEPTTLSRLLEGAGFAAVRTELVRRTWRLAQPGNLVAALRRGTVRTAALIEAQRPAALLAIEAEIARTAAAYRDDGWYLIPIVAVLGRAVKPG